MPKVWCVTFWWKNLWYCCRFLFVLVLFVSLWCDVRLKLQLVYPYLLMNLFTRTFVITRHTCHRCIYLLVTFIFAIVSCIVIFSFKHTYFHCLFFLFGGFGNFAIMWSSDPHLKHFQGVYSVCLLSGSPAAQALSFSYLIVLNHFSAEWLVPPQKVHFVWTACALSLFLPKSELLSIFR